MDKQLGALFAIAVIAIAALIGAGLQSPLPSSGPAGPLKQFATEAELSQFLAKAQSSGSYYRTAALAAVPEAASAGQAADAKSYSPTNIQVAGVDEADIVKTDGAWIYALANGKVSILRAEPLESVATIDAPDAQELFSNRGRLIILGTDWVETPAEQLPDGSALSGTAKPGQTEPAREALIAPAPDY
ncbi:MAG TPA: beta-propeller domain-containing protein, partial [archaeon]|nr:beta-propeller domain-containing protein [archaeon]